MKYFYWIGAGVGGRLATLHKGDNKPTKRIGTFKTDKAAKEACIKHYAKACIAAENLGMQKPEIFFI